jgi:hypothetical protein
MNLSKIGSIKPRVEPPAMTSVPLGGPYSGASVAASAVTPDRACAALTGATRGAKANAAISVTATARSWCRGGLTVADPRGS